MRFPMRRIARAEIPDGASLVVKDGELTTLRVLHGCVWVTEECSFIDHILVAGQRYTFDRPGVAIVTAHEDARVALAAPATACPAHVSLAKRTLFERPAWQSIARFLIPFWVFA